jgi:serine/threonine-protein kinase RsbW
MLRIPVARTPGEGDAVSDASPTDSGPIDGIVELRVPASSLFIAVLRSVTAGLAARCDLTLDEIEDLRIAVDEACALLVPVAAPGAALASTFALKPGELVITVQVSVRSGAQLSRAGFGWTVLEALVSEVSTDESADTMTITLTKRRQSADS